MMADAGRFSPPDLAVDQVLTPDLGGERDSPRYGHEVSSLRLGAWCLEAFDNGRSWGQEVYM